MAALVFQSQWEGGSKPSHLARTTPRSAGVENNELVPAGSKNLVELLHRLNLRVVCVCSKPEFINTGEEKGRAVEAATKSGRFIRFPGAHLRDLRREASEGPVVSCGLAHPSTAGADRRSAGRRRLAPGSWHSERGDRCVGRESLDGVHCVVYLRETCEIASGMCRAAGTGCAGLLCAR